MACTEAIFSSDPCSSSLGSTLVPLKGHSVVAEASPRDLQPEVVLQVKQEPANLYNQHDVKVSLDGKHVGCVSKELS